MFPIPSISSWQRTLSQRWPQGKDQIQGTGLKGRVSMDFVKLQKDYGSASENLWVRQGASKHLRNTVTQHPNSQPNTESCIRQAGTCTFVQ